MDVKSGRQADKGGPKRLQPERHAAFLVVALANKISASASRAYMRHYGIGVMEWRALAMLAARPGITANQIAQVSAIDKSSVSRAVQALIRRGYVAASGDESDNRRTLLALTPDGLALHDRMIPVSFAREELLLTGLTQAEQKVLLELLARLNGNMTLVNAHDPNAEPALRTR